MFNPACQTCLGATQISCVYKDGVKTYRCAARHLTSTGRPWWNFQPITRTASPVPNVADTRQPMAIGGNRTDL